jgi:hypothetical protein
LEDIVSKPKRKCKRPDKKELAQMKVMSELGVLPTTIAKKMGKSHHTVIKYLKLDIFNDPEIQNLIEIIKKSEKDDLYLLGAKSRKRLHELLDKGDTKAIETTAIMDRSFQQRRILENLSTENINIHALHMRLEDIREKKRALLDQLKSLKAEGNTEDKPRSGENDSNE